MTSCSRAVPAPSNCVLGNYFCPRSTAQQDRQGWARTSRCGCWSCASQPAPWASLGSTQGLTEAQHLELMWSSPCFRLPRCVAWEATGQGKPRGLGQGRVGEPGQDSPDPLSPGPSRGHGLGCTGLCAVVWTHTSLSRPFSDTVAVTAKVS